jgi:hypothetical protein
MSIRSNRVNSQLGVLSNAISPELAARKKDSEDGFLKGVLDLIFL